MIRLLENDGWCSCASGAATATTSTRSRRARQRWPVIEGEGDSFSAYAPELPGCIATGKSIEEVDKLMREAIGYHLEVMKEHGDEIPPPTTVATAIAEVQPAR